MFTPAKDDHALNVTFLSRQYIKVNYSINNIVIDYDIYYLWGCGLVVMIAIWINFSILQWHFRATLFVVKGAAIVNLIII